MINQCILKHLLCRLCCNISSDKMWDKLIMLIAIAATFLFWKLIQKEHNKFKFNFKFFSYYLCVTLCAFFIWPFFLFNPKSVANARFGAWLVKNITKLFQIEWVLRKGEILAEERGAVIVANHQSSFDLIGMCNIWQVVYKMAVIVKKELFYMWPFGLSAYLAGTVFINRVDPKDAYKQLEITSNVMVKQKTKIWVFPEGTRNKDHTKMMPFKKGAFTMAVAAQVPIIPVVFSPYYFINKEKHIFDKAFVAFFLFWKVIQKEHNKYKFNFKFFSFYLYASFCTFFMWPFFLFNPKSVHNARFGVWVIKHITKLIEIEWVLRNGEILAEERGAVIVSNHQSSLDTLGLFNIWHVVYKMTVISKKEIFYMWPFGLTAYLAGIVFINRVNAKYAYKQLEMTSNLMVKQKTKIWMFPEGTRNKDHTKMLPFKKGAFTMAVAAQVPIIPVVFSPYYFINKEKHIFDKGHVIIQCLEPISTEGLSPEDVPELMDKVQQKIMTTYKELTKEVLEGLPPNYPFTTKG